MTLRLQTAICASIASAFFLANAANAQQRGQMFSHQATQAEIDAAMARDQGRVTPTVTESEIPFRPVEDTADFRYVLMSAQEPSDEITNLRHTIAQNLPPNVKLVLLADTQDVDNVRQEFSQLISADRLIIASDADTSDGLWARDSFPVPVYENAQKQASLVAAHYYRDFTSWDAVANAVQASHMQKEDFTFVGGNLIADEDGNCFSINSYRLFTVKEEDLRTAYGCKTTHILQHYHGIGDVDEVLKPLHGRRILTNTVEYKADLEKLGYTVILLPTLSEPNRTYANSLIVGDRVFMPAYGGPEDAQAQEIYESLGYKVFPITSVDLSDNWDGSIHCQTMAYPDMSVSALMRQLHLVQH